jgi:glycosyltransferase involved in cell wall biosynthesis
MTKTMQTILNTKTYSEKIPTWNTTKIYTPFIEVKDFEDLATKLPEIIFITSYPPRECGIATYSQDLINALNSKFENAFECSICALEMSLEQHHYPKQPKFVLNTSEQNSFSKVAFQINRDINIEVVVIQHKFGFFYDMEDYFKLFYSIIIKPIVFCFHTVLPNPNAALKERVKEMAARANSIIVMTNNSKQILMVDYDIPSFKIIVIPHGTHLVKPLKEEGLREKYNLEEKLILTTFGLLSSGKGIETTLYALPKIIKEYSNIIFLILGKTHPTVVQQEGESYRNKLENIIDELKLSAHVRFVNEYLHLPELQEYLQLTDVYLFTSIDKNQAVSGTFSYVVSSGCSVIATPIPHACEVLSDNTGIIIDFENPEQLSNSVLSLLNDEGYRKSICMNALHKMASTAWQNAALKHVKLFQRLNSKVLKLNYKIPVINLDHILRMTTDFGMIQFAKLAQPDLESGYTLDDNARALIAMCQHYKATHNLDDLILINTYFQFIKFCLQPNGKFLNYVNKSHKFTHHNYEENLEDSNGRAIWALGYLISLKEILPVYLSFEADLILNKVVPYLHKIHSTRAMAFIIKGLHYQNKQEYFPLIEVFADRLVNMYCHEKKTKWKWYESYLTYANSVLPEALLLAYHSLNKEIYEEIALKTFHFMLSKVFIDDRISVVSNNGWMAFDDLPKTQLGGEQPIDVAYTMIALQLFYKVYKNEMYKQKLIVAFNWFLGENHLNQIIYNPCTGGCYDGLEEHNVNLNQGAESTLSYLMARIIMHNIIKSESNKIH